MRRAAFCLLALMATLAGAAHAEILVQVDKSAQTMTVSRDGAVLYRWPVSTGRTGYATPSGDFTAFRMDADHRSKEWDDAPMPHSIFFTKLGHAIHGTFEQKNLGRAVSHGCVRLSVKNAGVLWDLVAQHKMAHTMVVLTGEIPGGGGTPVARAAPGSVYSEEDTSAVQRQRVLNARDWREYRDDPRYYYDRERSYIPPRRYYGGFPFLFGR